VQAAVTKAGGKGAKPQARRRDEWQTKIIPALKKAPLSILAKESGMSRSALKELRAGRSRPHRKNQEMLVAILRKMNLRPIL
jgi:hypothetical protein